MSHTPGKSGFVSLIGRPNAGKSTLLNQFVGEKISIVTDRPQTTRHVVRGILSRPEGQAVFLDTPGIHKPIHRMNERMMAAVRRTLADADLLLLLVDASIAFGRGDEFTLELIKELKTPRFLVLNKTDLIAKARLLPIIDRYRKAVNFAEVVPISARNADNVELLVNLVFRYLPEGPAFYPEDQLSDQPERTIATEIIREKVILATRDELPYSTAVIIDRYEEGQTLDKIHVHILVERASQKTIVVGAGGQKIREIGIGAREELERFLGKKVFLELHVKVREHWRDDQTTLKEIGLD